MIDVIKAKKKCMKIFIKTLRGRIYKVSILRYWLDKNRIRSFEKVNALLRLIWRESFCAVFYHSHTLIEGFLFHFLRKLQVDSCYRWYCFFSTSRFACDLINLNGLKTNDKFSNWIIEFLINASDRFRIKVFHCVAFCASF